MAIDSIDDVIKAIRDLPPLPAVVMQLLNCINQEETDSRTLAEKISCDQALTAKTLRLANSSFYGMQRNVATISQAITVLGFDSVRTLVSAVAIAGAFPSKVSGTFNFEYFWRHSIATALCGKALAKRMRVDGGQAFMAGLLHDVGRLVLVVAYPEQYDQVLAYRTEQNCHLREAEQAILGIQHTQVGRALAEHWGFPVSMQRAIENHHAADLLKNGLLASLVHIADIIAHELHPPQQNEDRTPVLWDEAWNELGVTQEICRAVFEETGLQLEEVCQILAA